MRNRTMPMEATLTPEQATELDQLQTELVVLQNRIKEFGERVVIVFEGRDTAGKGGAILRFRRYLDPRAARVVALPKPTERERGQWYFQRYVEHLPSRGEMVLFDRSWYNRAIVEPVLGFCSRDDYLRFMDQAPLFERMLIEDGIVLIKLWFSIDKATQAERLKLRTEDIRRKWKLSPIDGYAQESFERVTAFKEAMFYRTHSPLSPWIVVQGIHKLRARTEAMRFVLTRLGCTSSVDWMGLHPDPTVVHEVGPEEMAPLPLEYLQYDEGPSVLEP